MATHSSIVAWEIPWTEEPGGLQSVGSQRLDTAEHVSTHTWAWGRRNGTDLLGSKDCTQSVPCWESQE